MLYEPSYVSKKCPQKCDVHDIHERSLEVDRGTIFLEPVDTSLLLTSQPRSLRSVACLPAAQTRLSECVVWPHAGRAEQSRTISGLSWI